MLRLTRHPVVVRYFDPSEGSKTEIMEFTNMYNETTETQVAFIEGILNAHGLMDKVHALAADNTSTNVGGFDRKGRHNIFKRMPEKVKKNIIGAGCGAHVFSNSIKTAVDCLPAPFFFSQRFILAVLAFIGNLFVYTLRVNLSVAIMCMVRSDFGEPNTTNARNFTANNVTMRSVCESNSDQLSGEVSNKTAEFDWDKRTRSELLTMYFYGYIITQIPSGWLASRYGGKSVWGICMFICAVCAILTPLSARTHVYIAYAVRFILGLAAGVTFPCVHALLGQWSPPFERSKMAAVTFAGPLLGNIATFSISGVLCEYGFDNGWGSIFYLAGAFNLIWVVAWFLLTADRPALHTRISAQEKMYIETSIGKGVIRKVRRVPWLKMFTSGPLWAVIAGHVCNNYVNYTLLTSLPIFMKESLNFDIKQNGALSALPYLCQFVGSIGVGYIADFLIEKGVMTTKIVRQSFQFISFVGTAVCIAVVGQMNCEMRQLAVAMLCLCTIFMSFNRAGYVVNHLDLAPSYSGVLFGITNTAATVPGMVAPMVAGALTPNGTAEEWRNVFYVCAAVAAVGSLVYLILADGELQPWGIPIEKNYELQNVPEQFLQVSNHCAGITTSSDDVTVNKVK